MPGEEPGPLSSTKGLWNQTLGSHACAWWAVKQPTAPSSDVQRALPGTSQAQGEQPSWDLKGEN